MTLIRSYVISFTFYSDGRLPENNSQYCTHLYNIRTRMCIEYYYCKFIGGRPVSKVLTLIYV